MVKKEKPAKRSEYTPLSLELIRSEALYIATVLGDLIDDTVVVGGLVPSLLIPQDELQTEAHVGTVDLDIGFSLGVLDEERYTEISKRLRRANFAPAKTSEGTMRRQTWRFKRTSAYVDFLIPPADSSKTPGKVQSLEKDFAAFIIKGLHLAFEDRQKIRLTGKTLAGETASRDIWVCGPSAFIALKALSMKGRREPKDAYDLFYLLRYIKIPVSGIAEKYKLFLRDDAAKEALDFLESDFSTIDSIGPLWAKSFCFGEDVTNDEFQADVSSIVMEFVRLCRI